MLLPGRVVLELVLLLLGLRLHGQQRLRVQRLPAELDEAEREDGGDRDPRAERLARGERREAVVRGAGAPDEGEDRDAKGDHGPREPDGGRGKEDPDVPEYCCPRLLCFLQPESEICG